jgi:hypothetical protein
MAGLATLIERVAATAAATIVSIVLAIVAAVAIRSLTLAAIARGRDGERGGM